jgi:hypothetical protein
LPQILPLLATVLAGLLWSPAAQAAASPTEKPNPTSGAQTEFSLRTGNGYAISVEGSDRRVALVVHRGFSFAGYLTQGRSSSNRIKARFGHFGRISVRFKPTGRVRRRQPPKRCKGKPAITRTGVFVGTISFRGEDGYVDVNAHRAKGSTSTTPRWRCNRHRSAEARISALRRGVDLDTAALKVSTPNEGVLFEAAGLRDPDGPDLTIFLAATRERRGSVRIVRALIVFNDRARTFVFDDSLRSATVDPPKPFHGSATFQRNENAPPTWSGSLTVSFLGAPSFPLTGPLFVAHLSRVL